MGSRSKSSTATTSNFYDQRQVNDAGGGVIGSGKVDNSIKVSDSRRTDNSIKLSDNSRSSTSTSTSITYSDAGAMKAAQTMAAQAIKAASKTSTDTLKFATKAQNDAASFNANATNKVFALATSSQTAAAKSNSEALRFARDVLGDVTRASQAAQGAVVDAYAGAADSASGNKTLIYAGLASVVAVIGLAVAFRS